MSAGNPSTGDGSRTPLRIFLSMPPRSATRIVKSPPLSGTNTMLHGCVSPLVIVTLIGRTRPVSIISGPSGSGGDGQLIAGGAVACPRPAGGGCCADIVVVTSSSPQTPRIALRIEDSIAQLYINLLQAARHRSWPRLPAARGPR